MRLLDGNASDILRDYVKGRYRIGNRNEKLVLIDEDSTEVFALNEETEYYLELFLEII
jgi:hypothetical protein